MEPSLYATTSNLMLFIGTLIYSTSPWNNNISYSKYHASFKFCLGAKCHNLDILLNRLLVANNIIGIPDIYIYLCLKLLTPISSKCFYEKNHHICILCKTIIAKSNIFFCFIVLAILNTGTVCKHELGICYLSFM